MSYAFTHGDMIVFAVIDLKNGGKVEARNFYSIFIDVMLPCGLSISLGFKRSVRSKKK